MTEPKRVIVRVHGGHYYVLDDGREVDFSKRGRMKRERLDTKNIAIGDDVLWTPGEEGTGIIEEVLPRRSVLSRQAPPPRTRRPRGGYTPPEQHTEQVIMANPDRSGLFPPEPHPTLMLDRLPVARRAVECRGDGGQQRTCRDARRTEHRALSGLGYTVIPTSGRPARAGSLHEGSAGRLWCPGPSGWQSSC